MITPKPQPSISVPNSIPAKANPLADWDNLPESHTRIGYGNFLVTAETSNGAKGITPNTYERIDINPGVYTADFQTAGTQSIDYIGLAAHNLGGETFTIQYATVVGGPYTDIVTLNPSDDSAIMYLLPSAINVAEIRFTGTFTKQCELGVIQAGVALQMYQPIYGGHSSIVLSQTTDYQSTNSDTGQFLGRTIIRKGLETGFSYRYLDPDWYRERFQPFVQHARSLPFFIKWRPDLFDESGYGYTTNDIQPVNMGGGHGLMSVSFNMRAHADV